MERQIRQSFVISLLIHAGFIGFGLLFLLLQSWLRKPEPVIFELVPAAAAPAAAERAETIPDQQPSVDPLKIPQADPLKPVPKVPDLPEPKPEPAPTPQPKPEPAPPKQISYEEWARNRNLPDRVQRVQQPRNTPVPTPEIETNVRDRLERQLSPIRLQGADIGQVESSDALQRYLADLRRRIQAAFSPSGSGLQAEAYFTVTRDGRITRARVQDSSGNPAFDQSVLRTLQVARAPGPPPGGRDYTFSLVFRSE